MDQSAFPGRYMLRNIENHSGVDAHPFTLNPKKQVYRKGPPKGKA